LDQWKDTQFLDSYIACFNLSPAPFGKLEEPFGLLWKYCSVSKLDSIFGGEAEVNIFPHTSQESRSNFKAPNPAAVMKVKSKMVYLAVKTSF
jgi:hypothetical protein